MGGDSMREFEDPSHWDKAADHYATTAHPFTKRYAEVALEKADLAPSSRVLDIAAGTGALAFAAADAGAATVLATDFSPAMVARIAAQAHPSVEARVMDGQALALPDASFDAAFSIFGLIMFRDWEKGLRELARVLRPGGKGVVATWQRNGAATFLLLTTIRARLFPGVTGQTQMPPGVQAMSDPDDFAGVLRAAGFRQVAISKVVFDFELDVELLDAPDTLFGMSPDWSALTTEQQQAVVAEVRKMAAGRSILPIPSTALIGVGTR